MSGILFAIDPGNEESALVIFDLWNNRLCSWQKAANEKIADELTRAACLTGTALAVEMIASYGMPVGREVFETCLWIGRFAERWVANVGTEPLLIYRRDVKLHLCYSPRAKDGNVRQALIDRFGPGKELAVGRKASPGPLYGLAGDGWAALGVAVTAAAQLQQRAAA